MLEWPALRFNTIVLGLTEPLAPDELERRLRDGPGRPRRRCATCSRSDVEPIEPGGTAVDRRPRAGRVDHRPDDRLVRRRGRPARRGLPAHAALDAVISLERRDGKPLRIGHRGAAALAPENTLGSFRAAVAAGVDLVEFDVLALRGGELVVAHSRRPPRGQPRRSPRERSAPAALAELRELCPELPTLDEALAFFADEAPETGVHVDLKTRRSRPRASRRRSAGSGSSSGASLSSFHVRALRRLRELEPRVRTGVSFPRDRLGVGERPRARAGRCSVGLRGLRVVMPALVGTLLARSRALALVLHYELVSAAAVARAHARGVPVVAWTVDSPGDLARVDEAGVDAIVTNDPSIFVSTLSA